MIVENVLKNSTDTSNILTMINNNYNQNILGPIPTKIINDSHRCKFLFYIF